MGRLLILLVFNFLFSSINGEGKMNVLVLSGSNNHNWQETTALLKEILENKETFTVQITNSPDTLSYKTLTNFDAIVSNWNSWPENEKRWSSELEKGILRYLEEGGGLVTFHASSSAFYNWSEFRDITTASWEENTSHGKTDTVEVFIDSTSHPITKGMENFTIFDELWIDARKNPDFSVLGSAANKKQKKSGAAIQPAIFTLRVGKGRVFHTILGHDTVAMRAPGFKKLMVRGTEWVATGDVKD